MKRYTKQQIIKMLERNCILNFCFDEDGINCLLKSITLKISSDEKDYNMLCDLLGIIRVER